MSTAELAMVVLLAAAGGFLLGGAVTLILFARAMTEIRRRVK